MFKILNMEGEKVGDLQKLWAGPLEKQRGKIRIRLFTVYQKSCLRFRSRVGRV